jgi:hypothetical protein
VGRRIWIEVEDMVHTDQDGREYKMPHHLSDGRVLSFRQLLPAGPGREKHLVQLWMNPGGMRTVSAGSIRLKDPRRQRNVVAASS